MTSKDDLQCGSEPDANEGFRRLLRRHGWHPIRLGSAFADRKVIRLSENYAGGNMPYASFYDAWGDRTVRELVRAIFLSPRDHGQLRSICDNNDRLSRVLRYLEEAEVIEHEGSVWTKGPQCRHIKEVGPTLEWYVAEWFRRELGVPARHGVHLEEVTYGADLDVVAFVDEIRVMVECKAGNPKNLGDKDVRLFLQKAHDFKPEVAVLLIDTTDLVGRLASLTKNAWHELNWIDRRGHASNPTDSPPQAAREPPEFPGYRTLYWCARNVFVAGVPKSIDDTLSGVLRLYRSYVRHQLFAPNVGVGVWDFVRRKVREPGHSAEFSVEGQLRFDY